MIKYSILETINKIVSLEQEKHDYLNRLVNLENKFYQTCKEWLAQREINIQQIVKNDNKIIIMINDLDIIEIIVQPKSGLKFRFDCEIESNLCIKFIQFIHSIMEDHLLIDRN